MKKILIFVPEFPVLTETFIERDISKLIELGNLDINVLFIKKGNGQMSKNVEDRAYLINLTYFEALLSLGYFITHFSSVVQSFKLCLSDNTKLLPNRVFLFLKCLGYTRVFSKYHPDEIHAHFLSDPSTIGMVASIMLNIPFSVSAHAKDVLVNPTLPKQKAQRAKFITLCNKNAYTRAIELTQNESKIHLNYHGVDPKKLFSQNFEKKAHERPVIFLGGTRLVEKKGILYVVEASKTLKERGIAHQMSVVGPGPLFDEIKAKISEYGLENNFFVHGDGKGLPFEKVSELYLDADIFVYAGINTSEGDADGIPNVLIEAAFAKLPIITTNAGSISEFVNSNNGIIIPQKDPYAIADSVERLIFDEALRVELGNKVFEKASAMFNIEKNVKELEALLLK